MKTGNTPELFAQLDGTQRPQWSPVMKTGNTRPWPFQLAAQQTASMEPGHEDREYHRGPDNAVRTP